MPEHPMLQTRYHRRSVGADEKQAALGAEGVLVKTGGDESREVVAGGKLESSA